MALHNHQNLPDSTDEKIFESFSEAWYDDKKRQVFDLKYSVSDMRKFVEQRLGMAVLENLTLSSRHSSSFELLQKSIIQLGADQFDRGVDMPQVWKDLIMMSTSPPVPDSNEMGPSKTSVGSKLTELESLREPGEQIELETLSRHEEQREDLNATITNSTHSHSHSSISISNNSTDAAISNPLVLPEFPSQENHHTRPNDSFIIDNMPTIPSEAPPADSKLSFMAIAVELVSALSNLVAKPGSKYHQILIYPVLTICTCAFLLSSTAFLFHTKRPAAAEQMQKAAFLFGAFGFLGIVGLFIC